MANESDQVEGQISSSRRPLTGILKYTVVALAIVWSLFQLFCAVNPISTPALKAVHLSFGLMIGFLVYPLIKTKSIKLKKVILATDILFALLSAITGAYIALFQEKISLHLGIPTTTELILGAILLISVLEIGRRVIGIGITLVCILSILYSLFGHYIPGMFGHGGFDWSQIIGQMYTSSEGIYGIPIDVSASFVFLFILFGAFLEKCGVGELFINLAMALFGRFRGGPAKVAVVSSNLFGMISGSAVANVVVTGTFTIPLMKKSGYRPHVAGAVEAAASSGGQFMPPIMGAAAFIIPSMIGGTYFNVAAAAFIPGVLYFLSIFFMVDFEARKTNLMPLPKSEIPSFREFGKKNLHLLIPILVLIYFLAVEKTSPIITSFWAIVSTVLVSFLRKHTRMDFKRILKALEEGGMGAIAVVAACACGGIIIGNISLTGLALSLSMLLVDIAQGSLILLLILTMISSLILGMGLTTTSCYIILAVLVGPALIKLGVSPMAAHLFIFYFGIISAITPPVALAAYTGAGLAGSNPVKTGFYAFKLGLAAFILPYMFVFGTALILEGPVFDVIESIITATIGIFFFAVALQGWMLVSLNLFERILSLICALCLIFPGWRTDLAGLALGLIIFLVQFTKSRKQKSKKQ